MSEGLKWNWWIRFREGMIILQLLGKQRRSQEDTKLNRRACT